ncbi:hypothetical protein [Spirosoma koreense]
MSTKPGLDIIAYSVAVQGSQDRVTLYRDGSFLPVSSSLAANGSQNTLLTNNVTVFLDAGSQLQLRNSSANAITVTDGTLNITRL